MPALRSAVSSRIQVVTWNVENLFHPETGGPRYDLTPFEGWTEARYKAKVARVAKAINTMVASAKAKGIPFIVGLTEVENERVVKDLLKHLPAQFAMARDPNFEQEYHDCVILYDKSFFELESCSYNQVFERFSRGDVVRANLVVKGSQPLKALKATKAGKSSKKEKLADRKTLSVFCCHLKARPSNQYYTEMYRQAVCDDIQTAIWKMHNGIVVRNAAQRAKGEDKKKPESLALDKNVVVMGDFNDEPFSSSLLDYLNASYDKNFVVQQKDIKRVVLYNCAWEWLSQKKPGSYFWERGSVTKWSMLDQIIVSPSLLNASSGMEYVENSFRVEQDITADENGVPFRTCTWDKDDNVVWLKGFSDHFPVRIELELK